MSGETQDVAFAFEDLFLLQHLNDYAKQPWTDGVGQLRAQLFHVHAGRERMARVMFRERGGDFLLQPPPLVFRRVKLFAFGADRHEVRHAADGEKLYTTKNKWR